MLLLLLIDDEVPDGFVRRYVRSAAAGFFPPSCDFTMMSKLSCLGGRQKGEDVSEYGTTEHARGGTRTGRNTHGAEHARGGTRTGRNTHGAEHARGGTRTGRNTHGAEHARGGTRTGRNTHGAEHARGGTRTGRNTHGTVRIWAGRRNARRTKERTSKYSASYL